MPQNTRLTAFTASELLRENQLGEGNFTPPPPTQITVKACVRYLYIFEKKKNHLKNYEKFFIYRTFVLEIFNFLHFSPPPSFP